MVLPTQLKRCAGQFDFYKIKLTFDLLKRVLSIIIV